VVELPADLYNRRVELDMGLHNLDMCTPSVEPDAAIVANVSSIAARGSATEVAPVTDPVVASVDSMTPVQIDTAAQQLIDTVPTQTEFEAASRDQLAEVWAGMERADEIQLSARPAHIDPSYYTQIGS
jgi:hypothetical protein